MSCIMMQSCIYPLIQSSFAIHSKIDVAETKEREREKIISIPEETEPSRAPSSGIPRWHPFAQ